MDYIESLGALVLDHRFKRIMNRLLNEATEIYKEMALPFKPKWTSTFLLIYNEGPITITRIAVETRLSHPAVIKLTDEMIRVGILENAEDKLDARKRLLKLSESGLEMAPSLLETWGNMAQIQSDLFSKAGCDILKILTTVEENLTVKSVAKRIDELKSKTSDH